MVDMVKKKSDFELCITNTCKGVRHFDYYSCYENKILAVLYIIFTNRIICLLEYLLNMLLNMISKYIWQMNLMCLIYMHSSVERGLQIIGQFFTNQVAQKSIMPIDCNFYTFSNSQKITTFLFTSDVHLIMTSSQYRNN